MKLSKKHIDYFKSRVDYYIKKLEINDYQVKVVTKEKDSKYEGAMTETEFWNGFATITLMTDYDDHYIIGNIMKDLDNTARHECLHVMLGKYESLARCRYLLKDEFDNENEYITRKLTRLLK